MTPSVLIAIHDVAPATLDECRRLAQWISDLDPRAALTLLAVPRFHGGVQLQFSPACRAWIDERIARGDEIALHGETHVDPAPAPRRPREWWARRVMTAREGEFSALTANDARARIECGLRQFDRCDWHPAGFVPPAWQLSASAALVLREFQFAYWTDAQGFHDSRDHFMAVPVIATSSRSAWRRRMSKIWLELAMSRYRSAPCVRVALHPDDARYLDMEPHWRDALEQLLATRRPLTKREWFVQSNSVGSARSR
jgi:uncharacterized protein